MIDNDFLLDEEDDDLDGSYVTPEEDEENEEDIEDVEQEYEEPSAKVSEKDYEGRMTRDEIRLSSFYDDMMLSSKKNLDKISLGGGKLFEGNIVDAVRTILSASPKNTSASTIENYTKELFQTQGHNRIPSSLYVPDQPLRVSDLDDELGGDDDYEFNIAYAKEAREQVANFIEYLASRDLSRDSISSKKRKRRQLPAFIIFLFTSGMYDLILNCPTLPPEYEKEVKNVFDRIQKQKYDIVEALALRYESRGRNKVADRVRKMGLEWFTREPAELTSLASFRDLELEHQDIVDYREFRPRYTNISKSLTQDAISDIVEVVIEPGKVYEKLKEKTRAEAIADVKQVYKKWAKENSLNSDLADRIIWKDLKTK